MQKIQIPPLGGAGRCSRGFAEPERISMVAIETMNIGIKRVYEPPERRDGIRVLVDRLWPRGLSKADAAIDVWAKDLAPSHELRRWFHSEDGSWPEFKKRYRKELSGRRAEAASLKKAIGSRKATFLYATKADSHNHAQLLESYLRRL